jgi:amidase
MDATALARALANGETTATEAVETSLTRLRAVHDVTNCVAAWNREDALEQAAELDALLARNGPAGPLHGVPFTVKDWIDVAGLPCTGGLDECRERVPAEDATAVARMRAAGAIVIAKTAVQVDSTLFGPVYNPRNPDRSPGGSSSGEAAAVGGGASPLGLASDSGGSIRVPAAWCGVTALKPSAGLVPTTGHFPRVGERSDGRTQIGPLARSVRDLELVLRVIAGPDDRDAGAVPLPIGTTRDVDLGTVRIGWTLGGGSWSTAPAVAQAVRDSVTRLGARGANLVGEVSLHLDEALDVTQRYWKRSRGELPGEDAEAHLVDWDRYRSRMLRVLRDVDVVVMPATASVAPQHRAMNEDDYIFTLPASLTGAPAVVVPVGEDGGLPVAVQIVGRRWHDHVALAVAGELEETATYWPV